MSSANHHMVCVAICCALFLSQSTCGRLLATSFAKQSGQSMPRCPADSATHHWHPDAGRTSMDPATCFASRFQHLQVTAAVTAGLDMHLQAVQDISACRSGIAVQLSRYWRQPMSMLPRHSDPDQPHDCAISFHEQGKPRQRQLLLDQLCPCTTDERGRCLNS